MIKVIVIDDEPLALQQIAEMVKRTPYFELVAACDSAFEAMQTMEQQHIDAIFTDINMPDLSGMKYIESLREQPIVVFTTAYSQYAVDGYKVGAVDYLLKPFGQPEFQRAAAKVKEQYELRQAAHLQAAATPTTPASSDNNILFVKDGYNYIRILLADIVYIESQSEYLKLYLKDGTSHMALMSLKNMILLLPPESFLRIHRSYIVNMTHIKSVSRGRVFLDRNQELPIGDLYKEQVFQFIEKRIIGNNLPSQSDKGNLSPLPSPTSKTTSIMRKFSFLFLLAVLPLTLSADDAVSGLVITKTNGERVEVAIAHLRSHQDGQLLWHGRHHHHHGQHG